ncbi:leucine-rich repeat domain-containing protein [Leptospira kirschneri]|uniref:Leucine rich repeat protein n=1 Tax=Leptospira kirschneri str. H1 TaxID=1049966 RepID=A0A0E2BI82_9LEPT|nr:leucine-rich repeat domain-containing protein [Leptospira kirschneri]EKO16979.1 leucine rich repeat protein [Leptospira kirschneri str. H1]UML81665.1 leucine-rich repeat domain-containing protein [Leptospira kirschneri]
MNFRITLIHLQKITIYFLFLIYLSCETQTEKVEPKTYMDLTEAIQNPLDVRVLNLWNNQLTTLPKEIGQLKNLRELLLRHNQLTTVPKEIGQLKKLRWLLLDANPILPKELKRIQKFIPKCDTDF